METWLRGSERLGLLGRERRLRQPLFHVSCTSSQAGEGASGALPSACVLHDLWPQSEVRENLGKEVSEGMDSRARCVGPPYSPQSPAWAWMEELPHPRCGPEGKERFDRKLRTDNVLPHCLGKEDFLD